jgi:hypothetical protein
MPEQDDLLVKLKVAVKAANEAQTNLTTAQTEMVSRGKAVGLLLLEVKKKHPKVPDFEAYLKRVDGLGGLSRAYDFMRLAGGRVTDEELRKEARQRQQRSRAKKKKIETKSQPLPKPEPEPEPKSEPKPEPSVTVTESPATAPNLNASARCLQDFKNACRMCLPRLSEADLKKAHDYFIMEDWKKQKEAA